PFILFVSSFTDPAIELVRYQRRRVDVRPPVVVHIGNPVYHANGLTVNIDLVAIAVIHFKIIGVYLRRTTTYSKNPVCHLKPQDFPAGETFVRNTLVNVIPERQERRRRNQQNYTG